MRRFIGHKSGPVGQDDMYINIYHHVFRWSQSMADEAPPGFPLEDFQWPHGGEVEEVPVPVANISCHFGPCYSALQCHVT